MMDSFDFAFSTLSDPCSWSTHSPLDSPDPLDSFDSILHPTFEREICSNFTCCGLNIPDLHELLAHFEATHVESVPVFPEEPSYHPPTDPLYDVAHMVLSFPQPRTLPEGSCPRTPSPCPPMLDSESDSATSPVSMAGPPSPQDILARSSTPELVSLSTQKEPIALSPSLLTTPREPTCGPKRVERRGPRGRFQSQELTTTPRKREKLYHCPKPGCLKSYLNPNGLKYHLDKGTCQLASDA
ncbi:hypothetical protein BJV78DRAFT_1258719 [Lactifluus subvellereus]|nr:hypothetical protein BJV78DRAFT_1258719 [Lactifluus subvellereus]